MIDEAVNFRSDSDKRYFICMTGYECYANRLVTDTYITFSPLILTQHYYHQSVIYIYILFILSNQTNTVVLTFNISTIQTGYTDKVHLNVH